MMLVMAMLASRKPLVGRRNSRMNYNQEQNGTAGNLPPNIKTNSHEAISAQWVNITTDLRMKSNKCIHPGRLTVIFFIQ